MLFTKKKRFEITEKQIKDEILSPSGVVVLKIFLRYPQLKCKPNDPLSRNAAPFYERLALGFADYAKTELSKHALSLCDSEKFKPYSALMRYEIKLENEKYLSVITDISISDGINQPVIERKTQVWERKFGTKCRVTDFFDIKTLYEIIGEENKKLFDRELFAMTENAFEFYLKSDCGYITRTVEKNLSKIPE